MLWISASTAILLAFLVLQLNLTSSLSKSEKGTHRAQGRHNTTIASSTSLVINETAMASKGRHNTTIASSTSLVINETAMASKERNTTIRGVTSGRVFVRPLPSKQAVHHQRIRQTRGDRQPSRMEHNSSMATYHHSLVQMKHTFQAQQEVQGPDKGGYRMIGITGIILLVMLSFCLVLSQNHNFDICFQRSVIWARQHAPRRPRLTQFRRTWFPG